MAFHLLNALLDFDDLGVGIGGKFPHHLQLDFRSHDLALEVGSGFDRPPRLVLQGNDLVRLLKLAQTFLSAMQLVLGLGQAVSDEHALFAGFSRRKARDHLVQAGDIEIGHLGC